MPGRRAAKGQMTGGRFHLGAVRRGRRDERIAGWDRQRCGPFLFLLHSGNIPLACIPILEERDGDRSVRKAPIFASLGGMGPGRIPAVRALAPPGDRGVGDGVSGGLLMNHARPVDDRS